MSLTDPARYRPPPEPLRIKLYGFWALSFPGWLVMQFATWVLLLLLWVGCAEVLNPVTALGRRIHSDLAATPDALKYLSWLPATLGVVAVAELCETLFALYLFRREWRKTTGRR